MTISEKWAQAIRTAVAYVCLSMLIFAFGYFQFKRGGEWGYKYGQSQCQRSERALVKPPEDESWLRTAEYL